MGNIVINPNILRWARQRSGLSWETLERQFPKLQLWLKGEKYPTLKQIERFANKTRTPLGYFFLEKPPEERLPIPHFRTINSNREFRPSPDLLETIYSMQRRQAWMREYLIEEGEKPLPFVNSAKVTDSPAVIAQNIRNVLGLENQWAAQQKNWEDALRNLRASLEALGILVVANGVVGNNPHRKLNVKEFRGFVLYDEYAPLVFINADDGKAAQMFTLAHEIAHIWVGSSAAFDLRELQPANDAIEQMCNKVAAEILVPENEFRSVWLSAKMSDEPFQTIARHFKVSSLVGARRALDLGMIEKKDFLAFYKAYLRDDRRKKKKHEGGDFYATQTLRIGWLFANTIIAAAREGRILYYDAYKLTGLHGKTFDQFATQLFGNQTA